MKKIIHQEVVCPCPGAKYMYMTIFSKIFSETALPVKAKFSVEPPWEMRKKVNTNGTGHMNKIAAMLMYG